ncbi:hypothetical protein EDEG_01319 [Edhazardia aedis USNM 41457]|uniref:ABC transporter domain-containing protein n=1 Tax=Edhazardia aedis (strain USNM 41457) TaxID=1003232 RepID=J9DAB4_EDHAE|nr:hypothetical protein EDEG_01319 [Edhazardia aedis USNM 41457]|eukprot:EJW04449.1 hypothetical protein EDEG_01319 [Edhazardia aedis USNM 41457]
MCIVLKNISVKIKTNNRRITILDNICGTIPRGQMTALLGESGSGKTALLNVISGIENTLYHFNVKGKITVNNQLRDSKNWFYRFGYLRKHEFFIEEETVYECVLNTARLHYKYRQKEFVVNKCNKYIGICNLENIKDSTIKVISRGEKQRLSLLLILLKEPEIILLDEPFKDLDFSNSLNIINVLLYLSTTMGTTILASCNKAHKEITEKFHNYIILYNSDPVFIGPKEDLARKYMKVGCKLPKETTCLEHIQTLTLTKCVFPEIDGNLEILKKFKELFRLETNKKTGEKIEIIYSKRILNLKPSLSQICTLYRRRFTLMFCRGYKRIFINFSFFLYIILLFILFANAKLALIYGSVDVSFTEKFESLDNALHLLDEVYVCLVFVFINNILLGHLFEIFIDEKDVAKNDITIGKYNIITHTIYVILYACSNAIIVMFITCLLFILPIVGFYKTFVGALKYIFLIFPIVLLLSLGLALTFSLSKVSKIIKNINQFILVQMLLMLSNLYTFDKNYYYMFELLNTFGVGIIPFAHMILYTCDISATDNTNKSSDPDSTILREAIEIAKLFFSCGKLDNYKFYYILSAFIAIFLATGLTTQYLVRVPKYRI